MFIVEMKRTNDDYWFDIAEQTPLQKETLAAAKRAAKTRHAKNQKKLELRTKSGVRIIERIETIVFVAGEED